MYTELIGFEIEEIATPVRRVTNDGLVFPRVSHQKSKPPNIVNNSRGECNAGVRLTCSRELAGKNCGCHRMFPTALQRGGPERALRMRASSQNQDCLSRLIEPEESEGVPHISDWLR